MRIMCVINLMVRAAGSLRRNTLADTHHGLSGGGGSQRRRWVAEAAVDRRGGGEFGGGGLLGGRRSSATEDLQDGVDLEEVDCGAEV